MSLKISTNNVNNAPAFFNDEERKQMWDSFEAIINGDEYGFFNLNKRQELSWQCKDTFKKFSHIENFIQVGIGGSSLGPDMLISALGDKSRRFEFICNIDPDELFSQLSGLDLSKTLFYVVSKSGGTAETMSAFSIICNLLEQNNIKKDELQNYFVFATDPVKSDLLDLGKSLDITCLEVPSNVGGRFSVLSPVGLLPALFAGINIDELTSGAENIKALITNNKLADNEFIKLCDFILSQKEKGLTQTVLMPYSSKLKNFSSWFVQLWAESLGKKYLGPNKEVLHTGLTPIASFGATDQHSQVQLFMEGPKDKLVIFIEVQKFKNDYKLKNSFDTPSLKKLSPYTLSSLMKAELKGTQKALEVQGRPYASLTIKQLDEESLGSLIILTECLTAAVGISLGIDPFNQPGVEDGKKFAFEWLLSQ
jgi:glucose-6-phosphate isomerase